MNPYALLVGLGLAALLQVSLLPTWSVAGVAPDLMLVLVVGWAILRGTRSALAWAFVGGLWLDLLAGGPFGSYTLGLLAVAYVAGLGGEAVFRSHLALPFVMTVAGTVTQGAVHGVLLFLLGRSLPAPEPALRLVLTETAYNLVLMLLCYPLLAWVSRVTGPARLPLE